MRNNVGKSTHFFRHGGKREILIALDAAVDSAGVLLREEAFGSLVEEVTIQANRADRDQQDQELVAKHPAQGEIVSPEKTVKGVFGKTVDPVVFACFVAEEARAHHGRGSERNEKRDRDSHAENDSKLAEKTAHDAAHHKNGDKDSHERSAHREHGKTDFAGALHGGLEGLHASFDVTGDVLDDDNGVVNHETRTDGQGHEREIVQTVVAEIHHAESADEGKWDGHTGDDGGPNIPEKCKDHENHKDDGNDERNFHVMDRSANRGGAVNGDAQMERGRNGSAE